MPRLSSVDPVREQMMQAVAAGGSSAQSMEEVIGKLRKRGVRGLLCEANERVRAKLWKYGVLDALGADGYAEKLSAHLAALVAANRP